MGTDLAQVCCGVHISTLQADAISRAESPGLWQLRDQEPLKDWVKGRCIIIGDAAHAMLPRES